MKGLKKVAGYSKKLKGYYDSHYLQLFYDKENDEVFYEEHCDFGHSSRLIFEDKDIISLGILTTPHSMKEIEQLVKMAVRE